MVGRRVALVTGAGTGIGLEVARRLAQDGLQVLVGARGGKAEAAAAVLADEGTDVQALDLDITDQASVDDAVARVALDPGRLDVLVDNAAIVGDWTATASSVDLDEVRRILETNLLGTWRVTQAFLPLLRAGESPRIVMVTSGAGSHGDPVYGLASQPGNVSYGVSKAALNALTTKLARELEGTGVLVNAVCPGLTATAPGMEAMGARPVSEGAGSVLFAARLPDDGPTGRYFRDGVELPW